MFIVFEGIEKVGKSTQVKELSKFLIDKGHKIVTTKEPGDCPNLPEIRDILMNKNLHDKTQLFLFLADRFEHLKTFVKPKLQEGNIVICDRFSLSTLAYQTMNLSFELVYLMNQFCIMDFQKPDITFLLDADIKTIKQRLANIQDKTIFDNQPMDYHYRVQNNFRTLYTKSKYKNLDMGNIEYIYCNENDSIDHIQAKIKNSLSFFFKL